MKGGTWIDQAYRDSIARLTHAADRVALFLLKTPSEVERDDDRIALNTLRRNNPDLARDARVILSEVEKLKGELVDTVTGAEGAS